MFVKVQEYKNIFKKQTEGQKWFNKIEIVENEEFIYKF